MYTPHYLHRVKFLRLRLATGRGVKVERSYNPKTKSEYIYLYRPLDNIMYLLGHHEANVDVLKIDVDGPEWEIFEDSIFKVRRLFQWLRRCDRNRIDFKHSLLLSYFHAFTYFYWISSNTATPNI